MQRVSDTALKKGGHANWLLLLQGASVMLKFNKNVLIIFTGIYLCFLTISCSNDSTSEISEQQLLTKGSQLPSKASQDPSMTYKQKSIKLIPYSGAISHPRSKPKLEVEKVNRENFLKVFKVNEISIEYTCVFNHRGLYSSSSINSVTPKNLYPLINSEFERSTWSNFNSSLCLGNDKSTTLRSVDVSVSIVDQ